MAEKISERDNFLRFVAFFVDIGTETVLNVFYYYQRQNPSIITFPISASAAKQLQGVLEKHVYYIVKKAPNPDKFDLSILITLVYSLFSGVLPMPVNGWKSKPAATDHSIYADLLRLRSIRNKIYAHCNKACLSSADFEKFWTKVEHILVRIYQIIDPGNKDVLAEKIKTYKHKSIEATHAEQCFEILKSQVTEVQNTLQEFTLLLKTKQGPFFRYIKLLLEGGRCCLSAYLHKLIGKQNSTLFRVLSDNHALLLKELGDNQTMVNQIYSGEDPMLINTETKSWDLYVIAIVITTVFGSSIKENKRKKVKLIRDSRRDYAYTAVYAISNDQRFYRHRENLVTSLTVLSEGIGGETEKECEMLIEEYQTTDPTDVDVYVNQLKVPGLGFKSINDVHRDFLEELKAKVGKGGSMDINLKNNCELEIIIQLVCEDKDKQTEAENTIDNFMKALLANNPGCQSEESPDFPEVRKTIETINSIPSVKVTCVQKSCLLLTIEYQSRQALSSLINYVDSLEFQQHLDNISVEMAAQFDEVFILQGHFTVESLQRVLTNQEMERFDIQTEKVHATQDENINESSQKYSKMKTTSIFKLGQSLEGMGLYPSGLELDERLAEQARSTIQYQTLLDQVSHYMKKADNLGLELERAELKSLYDGRENTEKDLNNKLKKQLNQMKSLQDEISTLRREKGDFETELEDVKRTLSTVQHENSTMKSLLDQVSYDIN